LWGTAGAFAANKLLTNVIQPTALSTNCVSIVSGLTWDNDQYIEVILNATLASTDFVILWLRSNGAGDTKYQLQLTNNGNTCKFFQTISGVDTQIGAAFTPTCTVGDVWRFSVSGCQLVAYRNFALVAVRMDAGIASGKPGIRLFSSAALVNAGVTTVGAGSPNGQTNGPWTKKGCIIPPTTADINAGALFSGISNQTMLYDDNVQLITPNADGKVFKIWAMGGNTLFYAESQTGLPGSWTRTTVPSLANNTLPRVFRNGSTYYMYVSPVPLAGPWTHVDLYTCTNGNNTWSLVQSDVIVGGGAGTWDQNQCAYFSVIGNFSGTWYAMYAGQAASNVYGMGLATAASLSGPWTKYVGNPVYTNCGVPEHMTNVGGFYYGWLSNATTGSANIMRLKTTDFINWSSKVISLQPEGSHEGLNAIKGEVSIPSVLQVGTSTYMFYDSGPQDLVPADGFLVNVATAPYTIAQLVTTGDEYFASQPIRFTDTFNRADGGLGANYTTPAGLSACQIASNKVEPSAVNVNCTAIYTGAAPALTANQFAEETIVTLAASAFANPVARGSIAANTYYGFTVAGATGGTNTVSLARKVAGSVTLIGPGINVLVSVGDVFRIAAQDVPNAVLVSAYQNGNLIQEVYDYSASALLTGNPGVNEFANVAGAITDAQISPFSSGNATVIYTPLSIGTPTTITISMRDGSTVVVTIPNGYTASQYIQALRLSGGVFSQTAVDPGTGAQWWPYRAWQKAVAS
jgi:hypothetical protein